MKKKLRWDSFQQKGLADTEDASGPILKDPLPFYPSVFGNHLNLSNAFHESASSNLPWPLLGVADQTLPPPNQSRRSCFSEPPTLGDARSIGDV
jgi:hypothetical protein